MDKQLEQYVIYQVMICAIKKNEAGKENEDCCELIIIFKLGDQEVYYWEDHVN